MVTRIVAQFQHLIEKRGLAGELWYRGKRRHEKSAQRIFFAVADSYCKANNLDVSPEADTGSGTVDFKFSDGYEARVLVEVKLSDNTKLVAGYDKQLRTYLEAERTTRGVYLVLDIGKMGEKDNKLIERRSQFARKHGYAPEVVFVNGVPEPTASKRR